MLMFLYLRKVAYSTVDHPKPKPTARINLNVCPALDKHLFHRTYGVSRVETTRTVILYSRLSVFGDPSQQRCGYLVDGSHAASSFKKA